MTDYRHIARVYLNEARARRGTEFATTLLRWAKNARTRGHAKRPPAQLDLFAMTPTNQGGCYGR